MFWLIVEIYVGCGIEKSEVGLSECWIYRVLGLVCCKEIFIIRSIGKVGKILRVVGRDEWEKEIFWSGGW